MLLLLLCDDVTWEPQSHARRPQLRVLRVGGVVAVTASQLVVVRRRWPAVVAIGIKLLLLLLFLLLLFLIRLLLLLMVASLTVIVGHSGRVIRLVVGLVVGPVVGLVVWLVATMRQWLDWGWQEQMGVNWWAEPLLESPPPLTPPPNPLTRQ